MAALYCEREEWPNLIYFILFMLKHTIRHKKIVNPRFTGADSTDYAVIQSQRANFLISDLSRFDQVCAHVMEIYVYEYIAQGISPPNHVI